MGSHSLLKLCIFPLVASLGRTTEVWIVGGTHGNEYNGVFCAKRWKKNPAMLMDGVRSPHLLNVRTLVANPLAHQRNRRFLDDDLNRQFDVKRLATLTSGTDDEGDQESYEQSRAKAINSVLGPKVEGDEEGKLSAVDFVIDLHSTTSNMGCTLIVDAWSKRALRAAAYVLEQSGGSIKGFPVRILLTGQPSRLESPFLCSCGKEGIEIELGPTPQGVMRHDLVECFTETCQLLLNFLAIEAEGGNPELPEEVPVFNYDHTGKLRWPIDERGFPTAIVHKDFQVNPICPLCELRIQ